MTAAELTAAIMTLQAEVCGLQTLVTYLLQKNETLRQQRYLHQVLKDEALSFGRESTSSFENCA